MPLVLYRKYRPETFSSFVGQEHTIRTVTNALAGNIVSHAYLFAGPRGTGKTSLARLLARAVNCEGREAFEACGKCLSCKEISDGYSMDIIEIDAASHRGIDDIRELREGIRFSPSRLKFKVFIIDECHQLSKDASNALLKTLEEPPKHAIFILATTEPQKMLPTIISRCQRFDFQLFKIHEIVGKLKRICETEKIETEEGALEIIAASARGSIRDAESLLDQIITFVGQDKKIEINEVKQVLGIVETELLSQFADMLFQKKQKQAIDFLHAIQERGVGLDDFAKAFINYLRQALILKIGGKKELLSFRMTESETESLQNQIKEVEQKRILAIIEIFLKALNQEKYSSIPGLAFEMAVLNACASN